MKNTISRKFIFIIFILSASFLNAAPIINANLLKKINTNGDEISCAITGNMKYFVFSRKLKEKEDSDLYFTEYKNKKWSEAKALTALNSDSDDFSPYISPDGKLLLFSSNRPGSLKTSTAEKPSYDIYYSERTDGDWGKPELLFGAVNTTDDEINPFITKDGKTLYFTRIQSGNKPKSTIIKVNNNDDSWEDVQTAEISKNTVIDVDMYKKSIFRTGAYLTGYKKGELTNRDVFYVEETEGKAAEFSNITEAVNTEGDEVSVTELTRDSLIISTNTAGTDGSYDFIIKKTGTAEKKTRIDDKKKLPETLSLKIDSENYSKPDGVKIKILYFSSTEKNSWPAKTEYKTPDTNGMISIKVTPEIKRVLLLPGDSGMKSFSVEFLAGKETPATSTIKIEPSADKEFSPKPVYFAFNSSDIQITEIPYIHELIEYLRKNKDTRLLLEGYSDGIGSFKSNLDISVRRAEKIKEYIVKSGVKKSRVKTKGYGYKNNQPLDTVQYNRRVDSVIITK